MKQELDTVVTGTLVTPEGKGKLYSATVESVLADTPSPQTVQLTSVPAATQLAR